MSDGLKDTFALKIIVVGNDVYVAGTEYTGLKNVAKYWKNGVANTIVSDVVLDSKATGMFITTN